MKRILLALVVMASPLATPASELVYTPVNPTFGGSSLNGSTLLGQAQAQDKFKDPTTASSSLSTQKTALQRFNDNLQQAVLSRIASSVTGGITDANGKLIPGTIQTTSFTIDVADLGSGLLSITTTDKATGQQTSFQIQQ